MAKIDVTLQGFVRADFSQEEISVRVESTEGEVPDSYVIKFRQTP